jgi:hypothetical protein
MVNILLIADRVRLEQIVHNAAKTCNARVRHLSSIDKYTIATTEGKGIHLIEKGSTDRTGVIVSAKIRPPDKGICPLLSMTAKTGTK